MSRWPIIGMHIEAAGLALIRKKEETIFDALTDYSWTVYDNDVGFTSGTPVGNPGSEGSVANTTLITHGQGYGGTYNGAITLEDIMDMMGALMANGYSPTDIVMHPLAWVILAKDPILRTYGLSQGQAAGAAPWTKMGAGAQQANMPFGLQISVSPFVSYTYTSTPHKTNIYVGSRNNTIGLIQGDGPVTDSFSDPERDIQAMKIKEYYGVGLLDQAKGWTVAKNIKVAKTYDIEVTKAV